MLIVAMPFFWMGLGFVDGVCVAGWGSRSLVLRFRERAVSGRYELWIMFEAMKDVYIGRG